MPAYLALGTLALVGVVLLIRWFINADAARLAKVLKWGGLALALAGVFFLIVSRQFGIASVIAFLVVPMLIRLMRAGAFKRYRPRPSLGQNSEVRTAYVHMVLDHDTGGVEGEVLAGALAGRALTGLSLTELLALLAECRARDPESVPLVETYLDRHHPDWRTEAGARPHGGTSAGGAMSREEALEILGLAPGAGTDQIKEAHRRLMSQFHPDHGGSTYLAAKINQAKDVLLNSQA